MTIDYSSVNVSKLGVQPITVIKGEYDNNMNPAEKNFETYITDMQHD